MPCAAFEDLLSGYEELTSSQRQSVNAHLAVCADCREYVETLADLDRELSALYEGLQPPPGFAAGVVSRASALKQPRPLSAWPEVLDFCGWAAIVAIVALLLVTAAARAGITLRFPPYAGWFAAAVFAVAAVLTLTWKTKNAVTFRGR
jgi:anti-sigma factor RsiW